MSQQTQISISSQLGYFCLCLEDLHNDGGDDDFDGKEVWIHNP